MSDIPSPPPDQEIAHLAEQCSELLRENERWRERAEGLHKAALAMRDEAVRWSIKSGANDHSRKIDEIFLAAAVFATYPE
jgi:hypothetical protein